MSTAEVPKALQRKPTPPPTKGKQPSTVTSKPTITMEVELKNGYNASASVGLGYNKILLYHEEKKELNCFSTDDLHDNKPIWCKALPGGVSGHCCKFQTSSFIVLKESQKGPTYRFNHEMNEKKIISEPEDATLNGVFINSGFTKALYCVSDKNSNNTLEVYNLRNGSHEKTRTRKA